MNKKILILEDEFSIRSFLKLKLKGLGYEVIDFERGEDALTHCTEDVDIALLDIMLPDIEGTEVCRELKNRFRNIGVIMLTAKGTEKDIVKGLNEGADDYLVKPFGIDELTARVEALMRMVTRLKNPLIPVESHIIIGPFFIDFKKKLILHNSEEISLTPTEFGIVKLLAVNKDSTVNRNTILDTVWGSDFIGDIKVVDVNMRRLRQKIEKDPSDPKYLKTVRGHGYMWCTENE